MEVPEDNACILFNDGRAEAERQIKDLCRRILSGWKTLDVLDLQVSPISGGISNLLVKVEPPAPLQPVAVKVFGDKTELLIDRAAEKQLLLRLNNVGFGAQVVGLFDNGRIERFLIAKTLTPEEMCDPRFIPHIARRLRAFHDLDIDGAVAAAGAAAAALTSAPTAQQATSSPVACPADSSQCLGQPGRDSALPAGAPPPSQWDAIFGWLAMAEGLSFPHDAAKQAAYDKIDFSGMRQELEELRRVCERVASPRVLCHNDLLSGNILIVQDQPPQQQQPSSQEQGCAGAGVEAAASDSSPDGDVEVLGRGSLQFIDFEYSCYGPRGFDFGNHFNEYAGFDCVYERFPSAEQQKMFFQHYLRPGELQQLAWETAHRQHGSSNHHTQDGHHHHNSKQTANGVETAPHGAAPAESPQVEAAAASASEDSVLDRMVAEACVYALASHAYWGVWSFIQARYSPIDFDYLSYSKMRWDEYHRRKDEFMALAARAFPQ